MQNDLAKKTIDFIKTEQRFFWAVVFLGLVFFVNQALYAKNKKTVESCFGGKCLNIVADKPQLAQETNYYYVDDLFKNQSTGYYRLTFQEKSDRAEKILLKLNTYTEKENQIGELVFSPADKFQTQEVIFLLPEGFDNLLFQKEKSGSEGNIFLKTIGITKLNVTGQAELAALKKTLVGETDSDVITDSQLVSDYAFPWLKENKTVLGQIFQAKDPMISAISFKIDINKNLNPGSRQYTLSLREAKYDGESVSFVGPVIADTAFSLGSIEKYRQSDGSFLFPLFGKLEKGKHYFVGLDNSKVEVGEQNYLEPRGARASDSYLAGSAVIKKGKSLYVTDGDLYFKIFSSRLFVENGVKILGGAKIEDLGGGAGKYSYATKGKFVDLLDLESASAGTEFGESDKVIYASAKDEANFSYAVNTIYPISKLNFSASQLRSGWKSVKVSYSFNQEKWVDLPFSKGADSLLGFDESLAESDAKDSGEVDTDANKNVSDDSVEVADGSADDGQVSVVGAKGGMVQIFNAEIVPTKETRTVYFKITYDPNDASKARSFALKNLKITADLKMP
jgi:hypothetical protein